MSNKSIVVGAGLLTMLTISAVQVPMENKVYSSGEEYYVGDNETEIKIANGLDRTIKADRESTDAYVYNSPSSFAKLVKNADPKAINNLSISDSTNISRIFGVANGPYTKGDYLNHLVARLYVTDNDTKDKTAYIKDASEITLQFDRPHSLYCPLDDCYVQSVQPVAGSGEIANFGSYFGSGDGVSLTLQTNKPVTVGSIQNKYVRIKYSYLNTFWSSGTDDTSKCKKLGTDQALPYTDWTLDKSKEFQAGKFFLIGYSGNTGTAYRYPKEGNTSYVKISLLACDTPDGSYTPIKFGDLYGF